MEKYHILCTEILQITKQKDVFYALTVCTDCHFIFKMNFFSVQVQRGPFKEIRA